MRIFKTKFFSRWAHKEKITDTSLRVAIDEIENGLIDADLGGHIYKKRVPLKGKGKRSGARTILTYRSNDKTFFIFGFAKSAKENISKEELLALKRLAKELLNYNGPEINQALKAGELLEIKHG